ncbi:MAG: hypothetical protein OQK09_04095 [Colwellia sp.]|nr:hypothetical protein [Colwellia sp.]MCW8866309.1 hypothetical protein [Colwellia sp.]MCW9080669.1 hypothetical protein [Colwellia sp.]
MLEQDNKTTEQNKTSPEVKTSATTARRSFLKKAAIGAPVVIASSTKPAWGAACMSGLMSGNVSNHEHTCDLQGGLSHGHWKEHWIGKKKQHFIGDDKNNPLKPAFEDYNKHYYVKYGQNYHISPYKKNSKLDGDKFQYLLINGTPFQREIVTALISASMISATPAINGFYPYSVQDVLDIYDAVMDNLADETEVKDLLEGIHQGAVQPD